MCVAPKVGIGWSAGTTVFSSLIRAVDTWALPGEDPRPSAVNHVFLTLEWPGAPAMIYESMDKYGVGITPWGHLSGAVRDKRVARVLHLDLPIGPIAAAEVWARASAIHGAGYDWRMILALLVWSKIRRRPPGTMHLRRNLNRFICSEFVEMALGPLVPPLHDDPVRGGMTPEGLFVAFTGLPSGAFMDSFKPPAGVAKIPAELCALDPVP